MSFSVDKCSNVNAVLHRTAELDTNWARSIIVATCNTHEKEYEMR